MTHEEAIESIIRNQSRIAYSAKTHAAVINMAEAEIAKAPEVLKQPQEPTMTRAEAIRKAAGELDDMVGGGWRVIEGYAVDVEFLHRPPKTTCIFRREMSGQVVGVGRSWCAKGDAYNQIIGKLIALYRALGREVPEWLLHIPQE